MYRARAVNAVPPDLPDGDSEMLNDKTSPSPASVAPVRLLFGLQLSAYTDTCTWSGVHLTYVRQYSFLQPAADGKSLLIIWCTVPFTFQPPWHLYAARKPRKKKEKSGFSKRLHIHYSTNMLRSRISLPFLFLFFFARKSRRLSIRIIDVLIKYVQKDTRVK